MVALFDNGTHKNIFFNDLTSGNMVEANQHVIIDNNEGMILDPGGHKIHTKLFALLPDHLPINNLKHIFFSHQDPDIIAAANGWLMVTDAEAHLPNIWMRFIPHFGIDDLVANKLKPIQDQGQDIQLGSCALKAVPAHYLHSPGNFALYDPVSKILYSGDIGGSFGHKYDLVEDFDKHIRHMEWFHKRYVPSNAIVKIFINTIKDLDIEIIAPQHGAIYPNKEMVGRFVEWISTLPCGIDLMGDTYSPITA